MPSIASQPYDYTFAAERLALVIIDMQRDFIEPGGFGAALGNDVSRLAPAVPDLSDCPPAKLRRGKPGLRIGDVGPMGRILINGEPGNDFVPELKPRPGEV